MGGSQSSQAQNILLLGLDGAGKTSILARLVGDEVRTVLPTLGFSVRTFTLGSSSQQLKLWDLGGRASVRHYWPAYYGKAQAIAFVIDTSDHHKLAENSAVLQHLLDDEDLIGLPLLVFANKQDAGNAIPASEIEELMHLGSIRDRLWHCTSCSALRGTGIVDGLHWLSNVYHEVHGNGARRRVRRSRFRRTGIITLTAGRLRESEGTEPITEAGARGRRFGRKPIPTASPAPSDADAASDSGRDYGR
mmetsp:Transcript_52748/g.136581  ORF Transcript_52748/g.136581 Transcript_52748/m.136581 type:complete len:248 (-) Transcript_52748:494-1237(-)